MSGRSAHLEKEVWLQAKAAGKSRFIKKQVLTSVLMWLITMLGLGLFGRSASIHTEIVVALIMLPVFLLEGYLVGGWKWKDFHKKYPN